MNFEKPPSEAPSEKQPEIPIENLVEREAQRKLEEAKFEEYLNKQNIKPEDIETARGFLWEKANPFQREYAQNYLEEQALLQKGFKLSREGSQLSDEDKKRLDELGVEREYLAKRMDGPQHHELQENIHRKVRPMGEANPEMFEKLRGQLMRPREKQKIFGIEG